MTMSRSALVTDLPTGQINSSTAGPHLAWDRAVGVGVAMFCVVYTYGPFRLPRAIWDVTWERVLTATVLLLVIRHVRYPSPWLGAEIFRRVKARLLPGGSSFVLSAAVASRVAVVLVGVSVALYNPLPYGTPRVSEHPFWNVGSRWDAFWYLSIANGGYAWDPARPDEQWNVAFFPAFPVAMRIAGNLLTIPLYWVKNADLLGGSSDTRLQLGGWLLSVLGFIWGLAVVYELARSAIGEERAKWAVVLLAYFPFALFFSVAYTEGLFFLAITSAFLAARDGRVVALFLWGALAALTRQTGVMLCVPLLWLAFAPLWQRWRGHPASKPFRLATAFAALGPAVGLGVHMAFLWWRFGDPLVWVKGQAGWWHSDSLFPFVAERIKDIDQYGLGEYLTQFPGRAIGTMVPLFALAVIWRIWRISPAYALLVVVTLVPAIGIDTPSIGRLSAPLFPLFIGLASMLPASRHAVWLVLLFGAAQLWAAALFFNWESLY